MGYSAGQHAETLELLSLLNLSLKLVPLFFGALALADVSGDAEQAALPTDDYAFEVDLCWTKNTVVVDETPLEQLGLTHGRFHHEAHGSFERKLGSLGAETRHTHIEELLH